METKHQKITGAQALVQSLLKEGVDTLFGYPGGAIMPVYDALYDCQNQLKHILTRHEQGAVHMAQGFARVSGEVGVCLATSGPGATNLITGIADAQIDSTPIVCITGQVPSHLLGTDAFQETDIVAMSVPVTKWNYQITSADEIAEVMAKAFYVAKSGRPGPVLVDITKDAQLEMVEFSYEKCTRVSSYRPLPEVEKEAILEAAQLINSAKKPYVIFGQGVLLGQAEKELNAFLNRTGIPAAWTIMGLSALASDHPLNVGMVGMHGNYAPNVLTNECDLLIAIGMRFDDRVTGNLDDYAKQAKVIHLDIDPSEIDKNVKTDVALIGDCKKSLALLLEKVEDKTHMSWLNQFHELMKMEQEKVIKEEFNPSKDEMTMGEVIEKINNQTNGKAVFVTDVGQHQMMACRYGQFQQSKSMITSGGLGTMGFCLPAAIGAKFGAPKREIIAVIGDGGFQMTIQELGTIFQSNVDIKILILNNEFLGMVRQWQELFFDKRYASTEMINPDFQTISKGYHIPSEKVSERAQLEEAIEKMLMHKGSYMLEVLVGKENNVFPMVPAGASVSEVRLN
jgi:acetolactate synthase-1/2/3 large subunit